MADLWNRQEEYGESAKEFGAFILFRDLEPHKRTVRLACELDPSGRSIQTFKTYSGKWNWHERSAAWDDHVDELRQKESANVRRVEAAAQLEVAQQMLAKCRAAVDLIDPAKIGPQYLPRMVDTAVKTSMLATGSKDAGTAKKGKSIEDEIYALAGELAENDKAAK